MQPIARWHQFITSRDPRILDELLADDAVFWSPAVHAAQPGKSLVAKYLVAALAVLGNAGFRYTDEWLGDRSAVLQFEVALDGVNVNGVDLIRWNDAGQIVEFKVMIRPTKALNTVVAKMAAQLA
ncbi:MAG TPA: nuclear transport factor 2 family protein [Kofleriaceae bacterium]|jgi:hypothetical protein|nr:nuclear transport factor 2 family protein [Kofleriaceae bacterium]